MKFKLLIAILLMLPVSVAIPAQASRQTSRHIAGNDGVRYRMAPVRKTGIRFPRLTYYSDAVVMKEVNRQIDEVTAEFGCGVVAPRMGGTYQVKAKVEYTAKQIFSIYASASWVCGRAYPVGDSNISLTFDLKTGKQIKFEELFGNYKQNKTEILKVIFATQLDRSEKLIATGKVREGTCEGDPGLYSLEHLEGDEFGFNFSAEGLRVQPLWPHVIEACSERVTVPYSNLKKFAAPEGLLARVLQK